MSFSFPQGRFENGFYVIDNVEVEVDVSTRVLENIVKESENYRNFAYLQNLNQRFSCAYSRSMKDLTLLKPQKGDKLTILVEKLVGTDAREIAERLSHAITDSSFVASSPLEIVFEGDEK